MINRHCEGPRNDELFKNSSEDRSENRFPQLSTKRGSRSVDGFLSGFSRGGFLGARLCTRRFGRSGQFVFIIGLFFLAFGFLFGFLLGTFLGLLLFGHQHLVGALTVETLLIGAVKTR